LVVSTAAYSHRGVRTASPREVVEAFMWGISDQRWDELDGLYADDAVVKYPFALPAPRTLEGRDAIRNYFAAAAALPLRLRTCNMVVHQTVDPEVVVAEWDYEGLVTTTGRSFQVSNVQVSTIRGGKIIASRDYHNDLVLAEVTGRLTALLDAITDKTSP
jgi:ketosteroid isomerase-like protein